MSLSIYLPSYGDPVSLDEAKNHIKGDADITEDDALIRANISTAREVIETATGGNSKRYKVLLATTFDFPMDAFPCGREIRLPCVPLIAIDSITYIYSDGTTQTFSADNYSITDRRLGIVSLGYNLIWPTTRCQPNAVMVRFKAGMAAPFTATGSSAVLTALGRSFETGDIVQLVNSGGELPAGLLSLMPYFVVNPSGSTFQLSLTSGGAAISPTTAGSGIHFVGADIRGFQALKNAVLLEVCKYYRNRGDQASVPGSIDVAQRTIDSLVASQQA